eukprot:3501932-Prymnesium_polylepis.1
MDRTEGAGGVAARASRTRAWSRGLVVGAAPRAQGLPISLPRRTDSGVRGCGTRPGPRGRLWRDASGMPCSRGRPRMARARASIPPLRVADPVAPSFLVRRVCGSVLLCCFGRSHVS